MFWLSPIGEAPPHLLGDNPEAPVGVARLLEVEPARSPEVLFFGHGGVALAKGPAQLRLEHLKVVAQHRGGGPVVIQPGVLVLRHALHVLLQHGDIVRDVLEGKLLYQGIDGKGLDPSWDPDLHSVHQSSGALHLPVVVPVPAGLQDKFALKFVKGAVAELELNLVVGLLQHVKNGLRPEAQVHELLDHDLPEPGDGFSGLRSLARQVSNAQATLLGYAQAMAAWHHRYRFCGRCGGATHLDQGGHVRVCSQAQCGETHYPRTDPAIIVLVQRVDHALFGRKPEWPPNRYSTIAGFVEPGESAEQAVVREVEEETGIDVTAVRYHSSQPWPFPGSLMLGYHAQAGSERISLNDQELEDAIWLNREELALRIEQGLFVPPPSISISYRLIEDWFDDEAPFTLHKVCQKNAIEFF